LQDVVNAEEEDLHYRGTLKITCQG
jgi:hypothetical protein